MTNRKRRNTAVVRHVDRPTSAGMDRARHVVATHLRQTPVVTTSAHGDQWLKLESLQPTGAFKVRGALVATAALPAGSRVIAASAGNHALGIAYASAILGAQATIVVAVNASARKIEALRRLPVELVLHGSGYDAAEHHAIALASAGDASAVLVSGYNDANVIAGNSTIVDELVDQIPSDRALRIVAPAGGGGLLSGIALRAAELTSAARPISVLGVEVAASPAMSAAFRAGTVVEVKVLDTLADGLAGNIELGAVTIDIVREHVEGIVAVIEPQIKDTIRHLVVEHGLIAEGAGATALAALRFGAAPVFDGYSVAILTGRNIALPTLNAILAAQP